MYAVTEIAFATILKAVLSDSCLAASMWVLLVPPTTATMLHAEETMPHADSVFLGEAEGRMEAVIADFRNGALKPVYDFLDDRPPIEIVGPARRSILQRHL